MISAKSIDDLTRLAADESWWAERQRRAVEHMTPMFARIVAIGAKAGARLILRSGRKDEDEELFAEEEITRRLALWLESEAIGVAEMIARAHAEAWWRALERTTRRDLLDAIIRSREEGWSVARTIEAVGDIFGPKRARRIAVTETTRLFGAGAQASYRAMGITHWHWRTAEDDRVDPTCEVLAAGGPYPMEQEFSPAHVNCLLPGTRCSEATVLAATRRWYEGEAIIIATASGKELRVTPNHPILTPTGWRAAGMIREGDQVIGHRSGVERKRLVSPDDVQVPTVIEEVPRALAEMFGARWNLMPSTTKDFHGDGMVDGEIDVVLAAGFLLNHIDRARSEFTGEDALAGADVGHVSFSRGRALDLLRDPHDATARRRVGGVGLAMTHLVRHERPLHAFSGALPTDLDARGQQVLADRPAVYAERLGEGVLRFTGKVSTHEVGVPDRRWEPLTVASVQTIRYAGHVYNLQTVAGWYVADDIVTHNCRCWSVPVTAAEQEALA